MNPRELSAPSGAGLSDPCPEKTRADLEWDRLLTALSERCVSPAGKRAALALPFASSKEAVFQAIAEAREAVELFRMGEPLPGGDVPDIAGSLARAQVGSVLANEEIRAVLSMMASARLLRRFLQMKKLKFPHLWAACASDPGLDEVERELQKSFDPEGTLSDRASPRLFQLRTERRSTRDRLVRKLEELIKKHADILQDLYWTERDGRYVLPVRADAHERFTGIVHTTSGSGATVFVEPRALVETGNRLKMLDAQVAREEEAIYAAMTARLVEVLPQLSVAAAGLCHADVKRGIAILAHDLKLEFPLLIDQEEEFAGKSKGGPSLHIELLSARHPLLLLDGVDVVPSDMHLEQGHAMVISGPNAGGKTIVLKTLGLSALMVRAGLPVAAAEGSRMSLVQGVLSDVGDDQNLHANLSTFSAHVQNLARILDATYTGVLVLLDEVATGTDPREGEALAAAVLDSLCARGGAVACTTHYEGLKALALSDSRFVNASVGFDPVAMSPTFHLHTGIPGASSALYVAKRFGIPAPVLERAERFLSKEALSFERTVEKLDAERRALELARAEAERAKEAADARGRALEEELSRLRKREQEFISKEGEALAASLKKAREDLRAAQAKIRGQGAQMGARPIDELRVAQRMIEEVSQQSALLGDLSGESIALTERPMIPAQTLKVGMRVYVPKLRAEADIVDISPSGAIRVAAGSLKLSTTAAEIRGVGENAEPNHPSKGGSKKSSKKGGRVEFDAAADPDIPIQTSDNTLDVRGLRAHEAEAMAEQFLDRSLGAGRRVAFIIHGHGTGALRDSVRNALKNLACVAKTRAGGPSEGGDGVTVVWLKW